MVIKLFIPFENPFTAQVLSLHDFKTAQMHANIFHHNTIVKYGFIKLLIEIFVLGV